jgi:methylated-DNA-[protein]-cysteine S-methyltransferase
LVARGPILTGMKSQTDSNTVVHMNVETPLGIFQLTASAGGLRRVRFPEKPIPGVSGIRPGPFETGEERDVPLCIEDARQIVQHARMWLMAYLHHAPLPLLPPLDLSWCTDFGRAVYQQLVTVPPGSVTTYGELAREAGNPGAARAVGSWMKKNQLPLFIPCHRVLPRNSAAGGWSGPEGMKEWLLAHEQQMS